MAVMREGHVPKLMPVQPLGQSGRGGKATEPNHTANRVS